MLGTGLGDRPQRIGAPGGGCILRGQSREACTLRCERVGLKGFWEGPVGTSGIQAWWGRLQLLSGPASILAGFPVRQVQGTTSRFQTGWDKLDDSAKSRVWLLRSAIKEDTLINQRISQLGWSSLHARPHVPARAETAQLSGHKLETKAGLLSRVCGGHGAIREISSCVSGHRDDEALFGRARYLSV